MAKLPTVTRPDEVFVRMKYDTDVPIPEYIYQYVNTVMKNVPTAGVMAELEVSKSVAEALQKGRAIKVPLSAVMVMRENIRKGYFYGIHNRLNALFTHRKNSREYLEMFHTLVMCLMVTPEGFIKRMGDPKSYVTRHIRKNDPLWNVPFDAVKSLVKLKDWLLIVHHDYPEFDQVLFGGTGFLERFAPKKEARNKNRIGKRLKTKKKRRASPRKGNHATVNET